MKDYKAKDKIIKKLIELNNSISTMALANELNIPHQQVYSCCFEMLKRNHINHVDIATKGAKYAYEVWSHPVGENFLLRNGGYSKEWSNERWKTFPERKWWLIAIVAFVIGFAADIVKDVVSSTIKENQQIQQIGTGTRTKKPT